MPSISPTVMTLAPRLVTRNIGRGLWMVSDEMSMNMLTKPRIQTPRGIWLSVLMRWMESVCTAWVLAGVRIPIIETRGAIGNFEKFAKSGNCRLPKKLT